MNHLIVSFALQVLCSETGAAVEILQASSRVSLLHHTHTSSSAMTRTGTYETRHTRTCAHKTQEKMTDTQVTHSLVLTPWLEACRRTGLTTHTHAHTLLCQPLSHCSSCTELSVAEGKKTEKHLVDFGSRVSPHLHRMY